MNASLNTIVEPKYGDKIKVFCTSEGVYPFLAIAQRQEDDIIIVNDDCNILAVNKGNEIWLCDYRTTPYVLSVTIVAIPKELDSTLLDMFRYIENELLLRVEADFFQHIVL